MKMLAMPLLLALMTTFTMTGPQALAMSKEGVNFPDQLKVDGKSLLLNGLGVRKATILSIKAYVGALYVEKKSTDGNEILNAPGPKLVALRFLRNVSAGRMQGAWDETFEKNCSANCERFRPDVERLKAMMSDVKEKDEIEMAFLPNETKISLNSKTIGTLPGGDFAKVLLSTWVGAHPPNEDLREGMLGRQ